MVTKTGEDSKYIYFRSEFQGRPITILQDKQTCEIMFNADEVCRILELGDSLNSFLGSDAGLDAINDWKKEEPDKPLFGANGMFREA